MFKSWQRCFLPVGSPEGNLVSLCLRLLTCAMGMITALTVKDCAESWVNKYTWASWVALGPQPGHLSAALYLLLLGRRRRSKCPSCTCASNAPQNNPFVNVAYFGVTYVVPSNAIVGIFPKKWHYMSKKNVKRLTA